MNVSWPLQYDNYDVRKDNEICDKTIFDENNGSPLNKMHFCDRIVNII